MRKKIVALILEKDNKVLVEKRKSSKKIDPNKIVFPAGHVENGETLEQALFREIKEELEIEISNPELVYSIDFDGPEEKQKIFWFKCDKFTGEITNNEAEEMIWIDPVTEINTLTYQVSRDALQSYLNKK